MALFSLAVPFSPAAHVLFSPFAAILSETARGCFLPSVLLKSLEVDEVEDEHSRLKCKHENAHFLYGIKKMQEQRLWKGAWRTGVRMFVHVCPGM